MVMMVVVIVNDNDNWAIIFHLLLKQYVVTPHLNRLDETVHMSGHSIGWYAEITKMSIIFTKYSLTIHNYHQIIPHI